MPARHCATTAARLRCRAHLLRARCRVRGAQVGRRRQGCNELKKNGVFQKQKKKILFNQPQLYTLLLDWQPAGGGASRWAEQMHRWGPDTPHNPCCVKLVLAICQRDTGWGSFSNS